MTSDPDAHARHRFRLSWITIAILLVALAALVLELIPANVYILLPGQALPVDSMIAVKGYPPRHKSGQLYMVDVSLYHADHLLEELVYGHLQSGADIEKAQTVTGGLSDSQYNQLNVQMMSDSIKEAEAAALSQIPGLHPVPAKTGPRVLYLVPNVPADRTLRVGDVILSVDGARVHMVTQIGPLVRLHRPGDVVRFGILRHGRHMTVHVRTVPSNGSVPTKHGTIPLVGIYTQDQYSLPVKVSIDPGNIGGPSAGLMFSLGIVQRIEKRDITKGCKIAGTGTMDQAGNVGEIGGAKQKIIAAEAQGAQYFFVPDVRANIQPAMQNRHNITVVPVKTLQQALRYLSALKPCR